MLTTFCSQLRWAPAVAALALTACTTDASPIDPSTGSDTATDPPPTEGCSDASASIDTNATMTYRVGIDAGYYIIYDAGGAWHLEWTCDTSVSATGCHFTGAVIAVGGADATCFQCEGNDVMTIDSSGGTSTIEFDTITWSGIDGLDLLATPGSSIYIDLQLDGLYQTDLVFFRSHGGTITQACMPLTLAPSTP